MPLSYFYISVVELMRVGLPASFLIYDYGYHYDFYCLIASIFLYSIGAFAAHNYFSQGANIKGSYQFGEENYMYYSLLFFSGLVILMSLYHYSIMGVPLFSQNRSELRFMAKSSGLFGIPGRFASYGPTLLIILSSLVYSRGGSIFIKRFAIYSGFVGLGLMLLGGNKSAIMGGAFLLILTYRIHSSYVKMSIVKIVVSGIIFGLAYALYFASTGEAMQFGGLQEYFFERFVNSGSDALVVSLMHPGDSLFNGSAFLGELIYIYNQVVGKFDELYIISISRKLYLTEADAFAVPVTPSILAPAIHDFGCFGGSIFMLGYGFFAGYIMCKSSWAKKLSNQFFLFSIEYYIFSAVGKGAPVYLMVNALFVIFPAMILVKWCERDFVIDKVVCH